MPWVRPDRHLAGLIDEIAILACVVLEQERGFARTRGDPPTIEGLLAEARARPPRVEWPAGSDREQPRRGRIETPTVGQETFFDVLPARSAEADTLVVHHHGLGEVVHDALPRALARTPGLRERCAWVALKGLHHGDFFEVSARLTADRDHFLRCLVASAAVAREVARAARERYRHLVLSGVSVGGVIGLIDAATADGYDLYVPIVSGPDVAHVLKHSAFSRTVQSAFLRRTRRWDWTEGLDLTGRLASADGAPIRPLLARSDRLFRHERQTVAYARIPRAQVRTVEGGHVTCPARVGALARHLRGALLETCWSSEPERAVAAPHRAGRAV